MAIPAGTNFRNDNSHLDRLTDNTTEIDIIGLSGELSNDFSDLLGDFRPPDPQKGRAPAAATAKGSIGKKRFYDNNNEYPLEINYLDTDFADLLGEPLALDRPIRVTTFPTQAAQSKRERSLSLRDLAAEIEGARAADKAGLPWFKLARFGK